MAGPGICILFLVDTCILGAPSVHPVALMDIGFLPCICLWHISQVQTCLCVVVGPGFVSTSPAFMRSNASNTAVPHGPLPKNGTSGHHFWGGGGVGGFDTHVSLF